MQHRFLMSVAAAALIAGTGLVHAQGAGGGSTVTPMNRDQPSGMKGAESGRGPESGMKSSQSDQKAGERNQRAQDSQPGQKSNMSQDNSRDNSKAGKDMKAEDRNNMRDNNRNAADQGRDSRTTTGQAGAGGKLSTEQRTKITTVIKQQRVEPVTNVNFNISIGTRVPREVHFHPLPTEIITIYPDWRGYQFILVRDQIVVVNPSTYEIVAVLDA